MKGTRLREFPISHFDYIFTPPGLPLVAKGKDDHGTTSVLVRGGAGSGKTTLALALAHAIAKTGGGLVLYLTTEFSPAEIVFKARLLKLTEESVDVWPGTEGAKAGDIVVEHLAVLREGEPVLTSAERKRSAIDAVWGLLHPEKEGQGKPPLPVRSVVIDALTLPDAGEEEKSLRADLVAFVQALESEGVSVVLVEELASGAAAWAAFVVDVVVELSLQAEKDTGELRRKLTLSKCRYSLSIPGPHDYGVLQGYDTIAVWPDPLRVAAASGSDIFEQFEVDEASVAVPVDTDSWVFCGPGLVVSPFDQVGLSAMHVLRNTPGLKEMSVRCGAMTTISASDGLSIDIPDDTGIHAIGWLLLYVGKKTGSNFCFMQEVEGLLNQRGAGPAFRHVFEVLRSCGHLVCVHGVSDAIGELRPAADYWWEGTMRGPVPSPRRRHLSVTRWLFEERILRGKDIGKSESAAFDEAFGASERGDVKSAIEALIRLEIDLARKSQSWPRPSFATPATVRAFALMHAYLRGRTGFESWVPSLWPDNLASQSDDAKDVLPWLKLALGMLADVGHTARRGVEVANPSPRVRLLWAAICAAVAWNDAAIDELSTWFTSADQDDALLVVDPLLHSLGAVGRHEDLDRIIDAIGVRYSLPSSVLERMRAEARLGSDDEAVLAGVVARLSALENAEGIPRLQRAEIVHNLGVAKDRAKDRDGAVAAFTRARDLNPILEPSRDELARLGVPGPS